jgi:hypothetical protein
MIATWAIEQHATAIQKIASARGKDIAKLAKGQHSKLSGRLPRVNRLRQGVLALTRPPRYHTQHD